MRTELGKLNGQRVEVIAKYKKMATTKNSKNLLFVKVQIDGVEITDHAWIKSFYKDEFYTKNIRHHRGEFVKFSALVSTYYKLDSNGNKVMDYGFKNIKNLEFLGKEL